MTRLTAAGPPLPLSPACWAGSSGIAFPPLACGWSVARERDFLSHQHLRCLNVTPHNTLFSSSWLISLPLRSGTSHRIALLDIRVRGFCPVVFLTRRIESGWGGFFILWCCLVALSGICDRTGGLH